MRVKPELDPDVEDLAPIEPEVTLYDETHFVTYLRLPDAETDGEVMQLPPTDELLLVAGVPPIRARKARYYEDARFKERLLPPPDLSAQPKASKAPSGDDWSALTIPTPVASSAPPTPDVTATDPANAGIRREPELPEHEEIVPDERPGVGEFDVLDEEPDVDAAKSRTMRQQLTSVARQATMDPADGIDL